MKAWWAKGASKRKKISLSRKILRRVLLQRKKEVAPGVDGTRGIFDQLYLRDEEVFKTYWWFCNKIANGSLPDVFIDDLVSFVIRPLAKGETVRPIAVPLEIRRVVAQTLVKQYGKNCGRFGGKYICY